MRNVPFKQVDVFTKVPFKGNPVAVVLQAEGLSTEQMQQIARWTNLSETTFVLPASSAAADYRVRIFTPASELPFAGHPTIGTAHALLEAEVIAPRDGRLVQECAAGLIGLEVSEGGDGERWITFDLPQPAITPLDDAEVDELEAILGCAVSREARPRLIDVGARWIVAQLASAAAVLACQPDMARMKLIEQKPQETGVTIFGEHAPGAPARIEVRSFAPACGIDEDPVCGSGNGCVAAFIRDSGQTGRFGNEYRAAQGAAIGRAGLLRIAIDDDRIQVGGMAVTCIDGQMAY
ncbi:phenazine biosynthesis protein PhzF family [Pseudomonas linyingensis]|uniref:Phenazine biosynthesis protein PhzF family n=1 Tax=Pseudomonas linyingensis TaxID=915471 RepID=A0A1H6WTV4_9PSED|nr:PhzF family phenazine biosynthesis protein [Pseudomonas linyingensis]SEJ15775.1 phenazine biosynthesis protein PhzF family [Pseudomonas linyingensis]